MDKKIRDLNFLGVHAEGDNKCPQCGEKAARRTSNEKMDGVLQETTYKLVCIQCEKHRCMVQGCRNPAVEFYPTELWLKGYRRSRIIYQDCWLCQKHMAVIHARNRFMLLFLMPAGLIAVTLLFLLPMMFGLPWWSGTPAIVPCLILFVIAKNYTLGMKKKPKHKYGYPEGTHREDNAF